jgi:hypothetical protein
MSTLAKARPAAHASARHVGRRLGHATSGLRMLPDFLIVGASRSGTTSLHRALAAHPSVVTPLFHKGVHYFDVDYPRGLSWYRGHFPVHSLAEVRVGDAGPARTFESSGYYMHHPAAPERIARDLPGVKLLVLLRDPVERAYSAHRHEFLRGFEDEKSFERALELEPARLEGEVERLLADPAYVSLNHRHRSYADRGQYVQQVRRLFDLFGRDRVHVLDSEAFFAEPEEQFAQVLDFLELPAWRPESFERHNARPRSPMAEATRERLTRHFEPYDAELSALLGRPLTWRREP